MYKFSLVYIFLTCVFGCVDDIPDERYQIILKLEQNLYTPADSTLVKYPCLSETVSSLKLEGHLDSWLISDCTSKMDSLLVREFDVEYEAVTSKSELPTPFSSWTSDLDKYLYIRALSVLALRYLDYAKFEESLVTAHYALHLIEVSNRQGEWPLLYADLLYITIQNDVQNYQQRYGERLETRTRKAAAIYTNLQATHQLLSLISDLKQLPGEASYVDSLLRSTADVEKWSAANLLKKGIELEMAGRPDEARAIYRQIVDMTDGLECNVVRSKALIYIADTYLAQNLLDSVERLLPLGADSLACSHRFVDDVNFFALSTMVSYYMGKRDYEAALEALHQRRILAPVVHSGQEDHHLVDVYVDNATNFLRTYKQMLDSTGRLEEEQWAHISSLVIESKNRNLYKLIHSKNDRSFDKMRSRKDSLSQVCSKALNDFTSSSYSELFELYRSQDVAIPTYSDLFLSAHETEFAGDFIDFIAYDDELFCFSSIDGKRKLQVHDLAAVQTVVEQLYRRIMEKGQIDSLLLKLDSMIFNDRPSGLHRLFISGDDCLLDIPLHILPSLSAATCTYLYNRMDISQTPADTLSLTDISLCSYTDATTYIETNHSELPELLGGYQEVLELSKSINTQAIGYMGNSFDRGAAIAAMNSSLLHLSTHAAIDTTDIYGAAFFVRSSTGAEKFYGYQLPTDLPQFVYLNACKTSDGYYMAGEGQYSLARYFKLGGSQTLIKSLWNVDDQSGKEFALLFYKLWRQGRSCHEAYTATQDSMKIRYQDPYYWAGFILEGNPNLYLQ